MGCDLGVLSLALQASCESITRCTEAPVLVPYWRTAYVHHCARQHAALLCVCELIGAQQHAFITVVCLLVCLFVFKTAGFGKSSAPFPPGWDILQFFFKILAVGNKKGSRKFDCIMKQITCRLLFFMQYELV